MKLTNRLVEAREATTKDQILWDDDVRRLGLKITPAGSKVYLIQYRMGGRGARTLRYTIGKHGSPWDCASARTEAKRLLHLVDTGNDPRSAKAESQREHVDLQFDRYVELFLNLYARKRWASGTLSNHESNFRRWIVPVFRTRSLAALGRRDITEVFDRLPDGHPGLPRNLFALMRRLFSWAVERGDLVASPMQGMKAPGPPASRSRVLDDHEVIQILSSANVMSEMWGRFIRVLAITGQRRNEVAMMRWEELDQSSRMWTLPAERVKNRREHRVPLSDLAVIELTNAAQRRPWPKSGYVFSTNGTAPISGFSKFKRHLDDAIVRVCGADAVRPWRLHDLRRTMATTLQRLGTRFEVTEALLNHVSVTEAGVASVYMRHDWGPEKAEAMQKWADWIRDALVRLQSTSPSERSE